MEPVIRIEKLEKSFGSLKVLKGIDLDSLTLEQIIKQALKKMMKG